MQRFRLIALFLSLICFCLSLQSQEDELFFIYPVVSGDGQFVFAESFSLNINERIWRYELETNQFEAVELLPSEDLVNHIPTQHGVLYVGLNDVSYDGSILVFLSRESIFATIWGGSPDIDYSDIVYRYDLQSGDRRALSVRDDALPSDSLYPYKGWSQAARISNDGRYIAFLMRDTLEVQSPQVYLYDAELDSTSLISSGDSEQVVLSFGIDNEGNVVYDEGAFRSGFGYEPLIYYYDIETQERRLLSQDEDGNPIFMRLAYPNALSNNGCCFTAYPLSEDGSWYWQYFDIYNEETIFRPLFEGIQDDGLRTEHIFIMTMSDDGRYLLFRQFVEGQNNIFLLDVTAQEIQWQVYGDFASMSDDAEIIAYTSEGNLFVYHSSTGETEQINQN